MVMRLDGVGQAQSPTVLVHLTELNLGDSDSSTDLQVGGQRPP